ncbi:MAG: AI-2E family transporter [Bacteroidetes bacterium]|nr:MAG: AI-2E family transporter [Bacteroidota bacterium]
MKNNNLLAVILGLIAVFVIGVVLLELKIVLLPFAISLLLSIIFKPFVLRLKKGRVPMAISLFGVLLVFFLVLFLLGWVVFSSTETFVETLPSYEAKISAFMFDVQARVLGLAERFGVQVTDFRWTDAIEFSSITSVLTTGVGSFISFLSTTFLILLFMLFILAGAGDLAGKVKMAFPEEQANRIGDVVGTIDTRVRQYLVTKTLISLGTGALTFLFLLALGVDFPLIWGLLAFVLNYIPNVGSVIAVLFPFFLSLLQFDTLVAPMLVLILLGGIQMLMGNVIEPRIMAFSLNLSPLLILVSLIFWGWLWGVLGMMLAVPLTATIKIITENLEPLKPLSVLMSGVVEPVEEKV